MDAVLCPIDAIPAVSDTSTRIARVEAASCAACRVGDQGHSRALEGPAPASRGACRRARAAPSRGIARGEGARRATRGGVGRGAGVGAGDGARSAEAPVWPQERVPRRWQRDAGPSAGGARTARASARRAGSWTHDAGALARARRGRRARLTPMSTLRAGAGQLPRHRRLRGTGDRGPGLSARDPQATLPAPVRVRLRAGHR
jgi:hypothetical protein